MGDRTAEFIWTGRKSATCHAVTCADWTGWILALLGSVWAADATVDYGFFQRQRPVTSWTYAHEALKDHLANHHMIGQMLIEVDGDEAVGEIYFQAFPPDRQQKKVNRICSSPAAMWIVIARIDGDLENPVPFGGERLVAHRSCNRTSSSRPIPPALRGARSPDDYSTDFFSNARGKRRHGLHHRRNWSDLEEIRNAAQTLQPRRRSGLDAEEMKSAYWPDATDDHGAFQRQRTRVRADLCMASSSTFPLHRTLHFQPPDRPG